MKQLNTHGRLETVTFKLTPRDVFSLLHAAGKIPEGFEFDADYVPTDWVEDIVMLRVRRYMPERITESGERSVGP
jgi:hypothetical protein